MKPEEINGAVPCQMGDEKLDPKKIGDEELENVAGGIDIPPC